MRACNKSILELLLQLLAVAAALHSILLPTKPPTPLPTLHFVPVLRVDAILVSFPRARFFLVAPALFGVLNGTRKFANVSVGQNGFRIDAVAYADFCGGADGVGTKTSLPRAARPEPYKQIRPQCSA